MSAWWWMGAGGAALPHVAAVVLEPPTVQPVTVDEAVARARVPPGDEELTLAADYIKAATRTLEQETGCAFLTTKIRVQFDFLSYYPVVALPWPPLQTVDAIGWTDSGGVAHPLPDSEYVVDIISRPARLGLLTSVDAARWTLDLTVGWTPTLLPPDLKHAVGLLAAHYLTNGRDLASLAQSVEPLPYTVEASIAPYRLVTLA